MRLDKYLAGVTDLSRSDARRAIKDGEVQVAGHVATDPGSDVAADAVVTLVGRRLRPMTPRYFMLHKPRGYVCATRDRQHLTVLDLLDEDNLESLHIAGRLDIDTTGLVLLTDDGQWSHRVTAPSRDCDKTYWLRTAEPIAETAIAQFERGLYLHDGKVQQEKTRLKPAFLEILDAHTARLRISEGKYHQVKRMFGAIGNAVVALHRERIGAIVLDPALAAGQYRMLTDIEIESVFEDYK
jgi:16S rRNA pseudouridine516 synthase